MFFKNLRFSSFLVLKNELEGCVGCWTSPERLCSEVSQLSYKYLFKVLTMRFEVPLGGEVLITIMQTVYLK